MDTVNHLNEHQLREELSRSQNTLAELQTNHARLQAEMDNINTGLCSFMTVLYGSPLPIASDALKEAVREAVKDELEETCVYPKSALFKDAVRELFAELLMEVEVDVSSCSIAANVEVDAYVNDSHIEGDPTLILREES